MPTTLDSGTPVDAVAVVLTSTDFDCTTAFTGFQFARRLYVGGAGDVKVTLLSGNSVVYSAKPQGSYVDGFITKVWKTGTTATLLVAEV